MRLTPILAAATLALSSTVAMAQMGAPGGATGSSPGGAIGGAGAAQAPQHTPAVNPLTAQDVSHFSGAAVYGSDGKRVGSVSTELMDPASKKIDKLVVNVGAVLGLGGHKVAMPIDQFKWDTQKEGFTIAKTGDEMKQMPEWADASDSHAVSGSSTPPAH
jgi:sporulation protein YlmC with PRC-barrel domain